MNSINFHMNIQILYVNPERIHHLKTISKVCLYKTLLPFHSQL